MKEMVGSAMKEEFQRIDELKKVEESKDADELGSKKKSLLKN